MLRDCRECGREIPPGGLCLHMRFYRITWSDGKTTRIMAVSPGAALHRAREQRHIEHPLRAEREEP